MSAPSTADPMRMWVESFPEMLEEAWQAPAPEGFALEAGRSVLLGGMGGSGMAGALVAILLQAKGREASWWRDPALPAWLGLQDRFVLASYSGETWEAAAMLDDAIGRQIPTRAVASGGRIRSRCEEAGIPCFQVPAGLAPRASLPWLLVGCMRATGAIGAEEVAASVRCLRAERSSGTSGRDPVVLAGRMQGRLACLLPVGPSMEVVALRWRNQILENAEQAAIISPLPEMAHNEIMGWPHLRELRLPVSFFVLADLEPPCARITSLLHALEEEAQRWGHPFAVVPPPSCGGLAGLLAQVYLGDRISVELADSRGVAATPVEAIRRLREIAGKE